ncbi:MAG: alpha/beta fold hydrolase [Methylobacteriaceae bacterium]|nr:alpha/beta fold hydrolase [Rhodoblastus sp.]MCC0006040.1 alpha/beta fold hydrolase [Methylobacteriaceae bacterium]
MFECVEFPSEGALLRGRLYLPAEPRRSPCVVMAHGTSATITMVADDYARAFHAAGLGVLLYDHRNFGASGGEPRQEINPWSQARGYRDAVGFLKNDARIDPARIAIWGDSYAGMIALVSGAIVDGVAAIVAQIPACGERLSSTAGSAVIANDLRRMLEAGDTDADATRIGPLPVVSADQINAPSLLKPIQAFRWFMEYGGRHGSRWENKITRVAPGGTVSFDVYGAAPLVRAPTLMMIGHDDEMVHCAREVQEAVFDRILAPKTLVEIEGGHFGLLWPPGAIFNRAASLQIEFLRAHLLT